MTSFKILNLVLTVFEFKSTTTITLVAYYDLSKAIKLIIIKTKIHVSFLLQKWAKIT